MCLTELCDITGKILKVICHTNIVKQHAYAVPVLSQFSLLYSSQSRSLRKTKAYKLRPQSV